MKKLYIVFILLITVTGLFIFASYKFSKKMHREVVEHHLPLPDTPGAQFYDVTAPESPKIKIFKEFLRKNTRSVKLSTFHMDAILNSPQFFRLLSFAEAKPQESPENIYTMYKKRYGFENKIIFTIMMHSPSGNMMNYQIDAFMRLKVNNNEYKPVKWVESNRSTGYHRRGMIFFDVSPYTKKIQLLLKDTSGGGTDRIMEWQSGK